jgi:Flp pilus assembly pilin Flp
MAKFIKHLLHNKSAATTVEVGLVAALLVTVIITSALILHY